MRYHGGKWKLAEWIISNFPPHKIYVEPFGGAASVLMQKGRSYAEVYNDLDQEVVNVFQQLRDNPEELIRRIRLTPFARDEYVQCYEPSSSKVEEGRRTIARSFMGFSSSSVTKRSSAKVSTKPTTGFRACSNRSGNTPAQDWRNYAVHMENMVDRFRGVIIENRNACEVMQQHDSRGTLHYVDPPYVASTRDKGSDYAFEMTDNDHEDLAKHLHNLEGMVVLSGYENQMYDELYKGWRKLKRNALADGAAKRVECLWLSPNIKQGTLL